MIDNLATVLPTHQQTESAGSPLYGTVPRYLDAGHCFYSPHDATATSTGGPNMVYSRIKGLCFGMVSRIKLFGSHRLVHPSIHPSRLPPFPATQTPSEPNGRAISGPRVILGFYLPVTSSFKTVAFDFPARHKGLLYQPPLRLLQLTDPAETTGDRG